MDELQKTHCRLRHTGHRRELLVRVPESAERDDDGAFLLLLSVCGQQASALAWREGMGGGIAGP